MDTELMTEEMVAELRAELKELVEGSGALEGGLVQLNAVEQGVRQALNRMGAKLTARWVETVGGETERGPRCCSRCGGGMRNVHRVPLVVQSIFGALRLRRTRFACGGCGSSEYPLDLQYGWSRHRFTPTAKEWVGLMCQEHAYESSVEILRRVSGMEGTVETLRDVVQECGGQLLEFRDQAVRLVNETALPITQGAAPTPWMMVGVDGCMVLKSGATVGQRKRGKPRRATPEAGEGAVRERGMEVKVGVIGGVQRTAHGELEVVKKSYVTTLAEVERFTDLMFDESARRGVLSCAQVVVMGDGAPWIWNRIAPLFPRAQRIEIVDWYHLSEKVWQTAEALYGARERGPTRHWAQRQLDKLWEGKARGVLQALRVQARKWQRRRHRAQLARDAIAALARYLRDNQPRIDYPRYRQFQLPIGTGFLEAACKEVVAARMKRSGMQWRKASAEPILHLRAEFKSGRWDQDWHRLRAAA